MRKLHIVLISVGAMLVLGAGTTAGYFLLNGDNSPAAQIRDSVSDVISEKDSGIAACEHMAEAINESEQNDTQMSEEEYKQVRKLFSESEYPAIRDNGTELVDLSWQLQGMIDSETGELGFEAFGLVQPFMSAYSGLSGGCAEQGIVLPPMDMQASG